MLVFNLKSERSEPTISRGSHTRSTRNDDYISADKTAAKDSLGSVVPEPAATVTVGTALIQKRIKGVGPTTGSITRKDSGPVAIVDET